MKHPRRLATSFKRIGHVSFIGGRGSTSRKVIATTASAAMLVALAGFGAQADAQAPQAAAQQGGSNPLQVTIGKTVALTTDQNGNPTPLNVLLLNEQISGQGSGKVDIPMGPNGPKELNVTSSGAEVQTTTSLGGSYEGQMPVSVATQATVNGKKIDPNQGYDLTGDVEITYVFTNHTGREQTITYKDIYGNTTSKKVDVPVPFGDSFSVTFGDGWKIQDPGTMALKTGPLGSTLSATVILFPIIQGIAGGTTQTLTIKAKADNASLPSTKSTTIPVPLTTYDSGLIPEVEPAIQQDVLAPLNSVLNETIGQVVSAGNLVSGYLGSFQSLATGYIDPLVAKVDTIHVNPTELTGALTRLSSGLDDLGDLMEDNNVAQRRIARLIRGLSGAIGVDVEQIVKWLGKFLTQAAPNAKEASKGLRGLAKIMDSLDLADLKANAATMKTACDTVTPTVMQYGYKKTFLLDPGQPGANALDKAVGDKENPKDVRARLQQLQTALDKQSNGTLIEKSLYQLIPDLEKLAPKYKELLEKLRDPACGTIGELTDEALVPLAEAWVDFGPDVKELALALDLIADFATSELAKHLYDETLGALQQIAALLSNDSCTAGSIVNPIVAAIKKYGAAGIKAHIGDVLKQVFSKCGLAQVMEFFGDVDQLIGVVLKQVGGVIDGAKADVPTIAVTFDKVQGLVDIVGTVFDAIPGVGQEVGSFIGGATGKVENIADTDISKISSFAAELQATIMAMNARVEAGDGAPYGNATGPNTKTMAAYQITQQAASPYTRTWATGLILALIFLLVAAGVGTMLYRRRQSR